MSGADNIGNIYRHYRIWDPITGTERGDYRIRKDRVQHINEVANKVASRSGGTKDAPVTVRLREGGTCMVKVYSVWVERAKYDANARPPWRKPGQDYYNKGCALFLWNENLDGSRRGGEDLNGIFEAPQTRLQRKYDELVKGKDGLKEVLEKEWNEWISQEIPEDFKDISSILVKTEDERIPIAISHRRGKEKGRRTLRFRPRELG